MKNLIAVFALMMLALPASASSLILGGFSKHIGLDSYYKEDGTKHKLNEVNPAIGLEHNGWTVLVMENSYHKAGVMLAHNFDVQINDVLSVGVKLGAVTGYGNTPVNMDIAPVVQFETGFKTGRVTTVLGYLPIIKKDERMNGVLTIHWKVEF